MASGFGLQASGLRDAIKTFVDMRSPLAHSEPACTTDIDHDEPIGELESLLYPPSTTHRPPATMTNADLNLRSFPCRGRTWNCRRGCAIMSEPAPTDAPSQPVAAAAVAQAQPSAGPKPPSRIRKLVGAVRQWLLNIKRCAKQSVRGLGCQIRSVRTWFAHGRPSRQRTTRSTKSSLFRAAWPLVLRSLCTARARFGR